MLLEGGTRVCDLREGGPSRDGTLSLWHLFGTASGAHAISLRILEYSRGLSPGLRNAACDEVLYALEGRATVVLDGVPHAIAPGTGIRLAAGALLVVDNPNEAPLLLAGSRCPDPGVSDDGVVAHQGPQPGRPAGSRGASALVRLEEREAIPTGDRWFRVLVQGGPEDAPVTQFVGSIPPGRAPAHAHSYEEVLCVLQGRGVMWAGPSSAPIGPGSCIFLPRGQSHCLENTGTAELRLLGIFYPAGSPAARYEPSPDA